MARPPPPVPRSETATYVYSDDETTEEEEEAVESDEDTAGDEESQYLGAQDAPLGAEETWYGKTRVGLHGQIDPEYDPDRTDPLTLSEAFGSRILRDHLLIGALESSLLDPFTPRQRGLVCLCSLVVTGLLACTLVEQPDISSELVIVGSTLAAFTVSIVLQHIYEEYQPRVRTVVPYLDERTGQYGLAKLSEAEGVANDIMEAAAAQKRRVTLEESRRRKRLQERARRRSCQVSMFSFVVLCATGGLGYLGYVAALRIIEAGDVEAVFWCVILSLIGQFVFLHTLKVLAASTMAVMSDHRKRRKAELSRRGGMHSESAAEALAARLGKPQQSKKKPPPPPSRRLGSNGDVQTKQLEDEDEVEDTQGDGQHAREQVTQERTRDQGQHASQPEKKKPAPPPRRVDEYGRLPGASTDTTRGENRAHVSVGSEVEERAGGDNAAQTPVKTSDSALALVGIPTPSAAANALPPLSATSHSQVNVASAGAPIASRLPGKAMAARHGQGGKVGMLPVPSLAMQPESSQVAPAPQLPVPAASVPRPVRAPASVPRPARKAPASVPRPPPRR